MGVGVLAWVSARQSLPLSAENKGKGTARKHQSLKYQPNTQTTRLLAFSALRVLRGVALACLAPPTPLSSLLCGSALQLPLRNRQPLQIKHAALLNKIPLPHALTQTPRLYS